MMTRYKHYFLWIALATGLILLIPAIAMQFTNEMNWGKEDFIAMGLLLFGAGSLFVVASRATSRRRRVLIGAILIAALFYVWAELAVGVFTNLGS